MRAGCFWCTGAGAAPQKFQLSERLIPMAMKVGIQLYSVRDEMKKGPDQRDPSGR